jgi:hypothetical protein
MRKLSLAAAVTLLAAVTLTARPAAADDSVLPFAYRVDATTHIAKLNQDVVVNNGRFVGAVSLTTFDLEGTLTLPQATVAVNLESQGVTGVPLSQIPLVTVTAKIVPTKPVTGHVDLHTFQVVATATFHIHIVSMYAGPGANPFQLLPPRPNLVGDNCRTATPMSVTMAGSALPLTPTDFEGEFTIPPFQNCENATPLLNQLIPGPGNTFHAHAEPL